MHSSFGVGRKCDNLPIVSSSQTFSLFSITSKHRFDVYVDEFNTPTYFCVHRIYGTLCVFDGTQFVKRKYGIISKIHYESRTAVIEQFSCRICTSSAVWKNNTHQDLDLKRRCRHDQRWIRNEWMIDGMKTHWLRLCDRWNCNHHNYYSLCGNSQIFKPSKCDTKNRIEASNYTL